MYSVLPVSSIHLAIVSTREQLLSRMEPTEHSTCWPWPELAYQDRAIKCICHLMELPCERAHSLLRSLRISETTNLYSNNHTFFSFFHRVSNWLDSYNSVAFVRSLVELLAPGRSAAPQTIQGRAVTRFKIGVAQVVRVVALRILGALSVRNFWPLRPYEQPTAAKPHTSPVNFHIYSWDNFVFSCSLILFRNHLRKSFGDPSATFRSPFAYLVSSHFSYLKEEKGQELTVF